MSTNDAIIIYFRKGYRINADGYLVSPSGVIRKAKKRKDGYFEVSFRMEGRFYHILLHRLCAYQKYGEIVFMADCVRHLDGDKSNNAPDNIEIGTDSDNAMDVPCLLRTERAVRATMCTSGYRNNEIVKEIRDYHKSTNSYKLTMRRFGISSKGTLHYILNERTS